jgi:hypothetical protein
MKSILLPNLRSKVIPKWLRTLTLSLLRKLQGLRAPQTMKMMSLRCYKKSLNQRKKL